MSQTQYAKQLYCIVTVEGRVCHKFKVPDRNGRLSLTLATETSKTDEGITTEMYREDNTEVEIHASSLETFVQTDKPINKPGETGTCRLKSMLLLKKHLYRQTNLFISQGKQVG